jgi:hypothetical protein
MAKLKKDITVNTDTLIEELEEHIYDQGMMDVLEELQDIYTYSRDKEAYKNMLRGVFITLQALRNIKK